LTDSNCSRTNDTDGTNTAADTTAVTKPILLELTEEAKQQEIVSSFVFDPETDNLSVELNHKYSKKKITSPIESNWPKTIDTFAKELGRKKISQEHILMLCDVADNAADKILRLRLNRQTEMEKEEENNEKLGSRARKLLSIAERQCQELFVDQYGEPYAAVKIGEHTETLNLNHTRFRNWICKENYQQDGSVASSENITNVLNILKAKAEFDGNSKELHLRVAYDTKKDETGTARTIRTTIFYDFTNPGWEAVKITPEGWSVEKAPAIFRRHNAQSQVYPSKDYPPDIFDRFMKLLNIKDEKTKLLIKCYIIALFIPEIDKPILMLHGDAGGAKSTLEELVRTLVDPSSVLTFALPRDISELVQQLDHNYVVYYDNISRMWEWISDQFCRASTGGGSSKRRLYTDDDDKIYNFKRCVGFNGVNLAATKSDLLDRGLIIKVERIDDKFKRLRQHIWREFEDMRPQLLGYILDLLVKFLAIRQTTSIKFEKLPRMADFAECAELISRCMGNPDGLFMDAYYENIELQTEEILETSVVASALLKFMYSKEEWNGTATDLLEQLDQIVGEKTSKNKYWPKTASVLSRRINEVKTNLREVGIFIKEGQQDPVTRVKTIVITKPSDIGKMPFEQFEPFDRRGSENQNNNDAQDGTSNGMNDMNGILRNPSGATPQNIMSNEIDKATTRSKDESENNEANNGTPNDMNDPNGILHNSAEPTVQNTNGIVSGDTTNPKLPPYVYRLGHSDRFACKYCSIKDDKWGMIKHYHAEEECDPK
jgi:hypothetical protein